MSCGALIYELGPRKLIPFFFAAFFSILSVDEIYGHDLKFPEDELRENLVRRYKGCVHVENKEIKFQEQTQQYPWDLILLLTTSDFYYFFWVDVIMVKYAQ